MNGESRARGSHYLLLFRASELAQYRLCYGGGGLNGEGVHKHARRRRHCVGLFSPQAFDSEKKPHQA